MIAKARRIRIARPLFMRYGYGSPAKGGKRTPREMACFFYAMGHNSRKLKI